MFCPKCGVAIPENSMKCSNCAFEIGEDDIQDSRKETSVHKNNEHTQSIPTSLSTQMDSGWDKAKRIIFPIIGAVVLVMCFMAASSINEGGTEIMQISSVGGKTLEEAYYRELGSIYSGYANVVRALGISLASFLVWLGFKK